MCSLSATVTAKPDSSCSMRSFSLLFCAALAMSRSLILVSSTMLCLWFWRDTSGKNVYGNDKVHGKNQGTAFLFYLSLPFPGMQLFSPDWTPAWTDNFLDLSHWDTVKKWKKKMAQLKPQFKKKTMQKHVSFSRTEMPHQSWQESFITKCSPDGFVYIQRFSLSVFRGHKQWEEAACHAWVEAPESLARGNWIQARKTCSVCAPRSSAFWWMSHLSVDV